MKDIIQLTLGNVEKTTLSRKETVSPFDGGLFNRAIIVETDKVIVQVILTGRNVEVENEEA